MHLNERATKIWMKALWQAVHDGDGGPETAGVAISTVVQGIATGIIEIGAPTPVVAPLCKVLLEAKDMVDEASNNKQELQELYALCEVITVQVIVKAKASKTSRIVVAPLVEFVDKLKIVAKRYHSRRTFTRLMQSIRNGDDIQKLRTSIENIVPIMGLSGVVLIADRLEDVRQMVVRFSTLEFISS